MDEAGHGCCLFGQGQPQAVVFYTRLRSDGKFRLHCLRHRQILQSIFKSRAGGEIGGRG